MVGSVHLHVPSPLSVKSPPVHSEVSMHKVPILE
jgi:hypothetical protein